MLPSGMERQRHGAESRGAMQFTLQLHCACVSRSELQVGPSRLAFQPKLPHLRTHQHHGEIGVQDRVRQLFDPALEVDPRSSCLDIREARRRPGPALPGRRILHVRRKQQHGRDVPPARGKAHQVYAGVRQLNPAQLKAAPPQRRQARFRQDFGREQGGFRAEARLLIDLKIADGKRRPGKHAQ